MATQVHRTDRSLGQVAEYKALPSLDTIVFIDIATERVRIVQRTGPNGWNETGCDEPVDVDLPAFGVVLPHNEIFARD